MRVASAGLAVRRTPVSEKTVALGAGAGGGEHTGQNCAGCQASRGFVCVCARMNVCMP